MSRPLFRPRADPFIRGTGSGREREFVESEETKNRRVIVMDANNPIAQELLKAEGK